MAGKALAKARTGNLTITMAESAVSALGVGRSWHPDAGRMDIQRYLTGAWCRSAPVLHTRYRHRYLPAAPSDGRQVQTFNGFVALSFLNREPPTFGL